MSKWFEPDTNALANEFKTEPSIQALYDADGYSFITGNSLGIDAQMHIFLRHTAPYSGYFKIETVSWKALRELEHYTCSDLNELSKITYHMGKQPAELLKSLETSGVPFILLLRKRDGSLRMLGGRTRASICILYNFDAQAMVLDEAVISKDVFRHIKEGFFERDHHGDARYIWDQALKILGEEQTFEDMPADNFDDFNRKVSVRILLRAMKKYGFNPRDDK